MASASNSLTPPAPKRMKMASGDAVAVSRLAPSPQVLTDVQANAYFGDHLKGAEDRKFGKPVFVTATEDFPNDIVWVRTEGKKGNMYFRPQTKVNGMRCNICFTIVDDSSDVSAAPVYTFGSKQNQFGRWEASFTIRCSDKARRALFARIEEAAKYILAEEGATMKSDVLYLSEKTSPFYGRSAYFSCGLEHKYMSAMVGDRALDRTDVPKGNVTKRMDVTLSIWLQRLKSIGGIDFTVKVLSM